MTMTKTEMICAVKAIQTQTIVQRGAIEAAEASLGGYVLSSHATNARTVYRLNDEADQKLLDQLCDARITAQNHVAALQHVIDELSSPGCRQKGSA